MKPIVYVFSGLTGGFGDVPNPVVSYGVQKLAEKLGAKLEVSLSGYDDVPEVTQEIIAAHAADPSRPVCLIGHSNGGYAVLQIANKLATYNIPVAYLGIIELTMKSSPAVPGNVAVVDHFEATASVVNVFNKLLLSADFRTNDGLFRRFEYPTTHIALSAHEKVQSRIIEQVNSALPVVADPINVPTVETPPLTLRMLLEVSRVEGLVREAYKDSVGNLTWSIGVTSYSGHRVERYIGKPQTIERCLDIYVWLVATKYWPRVVKAFEGYPLSEEQAAAALSFDWNTGSIDTASWVDAVKRGDLADAKRRFMLWNKPASIIERRQQELDLFFNGKWRSDGTLTLYSGVNSALRPVGGSKYNIMPDMAAALERFENGSAGANTPVPVPEPIPPSNPAPELVLGDLAAFLAGRYPDTTEQARTHAAMLADAVAYRLQPAALPAASIERKAAMNLGYIAKMLGALIGGGGFAAIAETILPAPLATPEFINAMTVLFAALGTYFAPRNNYGDS